MKFFLIIFGFFYLNLTELALANVKILEWNEKSQITEYGRNSQFFIKIQITDIPANSGIKSFSITRQNPDRTSEISEVRVNKNIVDFKNSSNSFEIFFQNLLQNNQIAEIEYKSKEFYQKTNKYLHQEPFYIPSFASGAKSYVEINFDKNFELISTHNNLISSTQKAIYSGMVPSDGVKEILKLTNNGVNWNVLIKNKINFKDSNGTAEIKLSYLFQGGTQKVNDQIISSSLKPKKHLTTRQNDIFTFDITPQITQVIIENQAAISTGSKFRVKNALSPYEYIKISKSEEMMLSPILSKIISDPKYRSMPIYAKIVRFVHDFLKYDIQYLGKELSVEQILQTKSGVCLEYATLFNALARTAQIPSLIIYGYAFGEYGKFEAHAWNMIYQAGNWIYVDPTWNLSSGAVSSSHIYLQDNKSEGDKFGEISVSFKGEKGEISSIDRDFEITEINNK